MTNFGVLWDMDGVLVDTGDFHYQAWQQVLDREGIFFSETAFRNTFGMHNARILELLLGAPPDEATLVRIGDAKESLFRRIFHGRATPMSGVLDWIERLHRQGVPQAVASGAPQETIEFLIDEMSLRPYFGALVSAQGMPSKPDPAVFLEAARRIGIPPTRCVVIEDGLPGLEAACRGGMRTVGVTTPHPARALQADIVVDSLVDLPANTFEQWFS